jgi:hypothetical protein
VVAPESSTLLDNCSDTTSHLITRSHVESGQNPRIKRAVLHRAALYGLWVFLTDCKNSAPPQSAVSVRLRTFRVIRVG